MFVQSASHTVFVLFVLGTFVFIKRYIVIGYVVQAQQSAIKRNINKCSKWLRTELLKVSCQNVCWTYNLVFFYRFWINIYCRWITKKMTFFKIIHETYFIVWYLNNVFQMINCIIIFIFFKYWKPETFLFIVNCQIWHVKVIVVDTLLMF